MIDSAAEAFTPSPNSPEQKGTPSKVKELKRKIKEAGDDTILLGKKSRDGKPLHLLVTHREFQPYPEAMEIHRKYKGTESEAYHTPIRGISWIHIFEEQPGGEKTPVGRYGWTIWGAHFSDRYALDSGSGALSLGDRTKFGNSNPDLAKAERLWWNDSASFLVEPDYQHQGIGTFLLSASVAAMDAFGIKTFMPTILLVDSTKRWVSAGLIPREATELDKLIDEPKAHPVYFHPVDKHLDVKSALAKPVVQSSIAEFI